MGRGIGKYSTAAAIEDPINPSVNVNYTQLLIDGKFVDAASGEFSILFISSDEFELYFPQKFGKCIMLRNVFLLPFSIKMCLLWSQGKPFQHWTLGLGM